MRKLWKAMRFCNKTTILKNRKRFARIPKEEERAKKEWGTAERG